MARPGKREREAFKAQQADKAARLAEMQAVGARHLPIPEPMAQRKDKRRQTSKRSIGVHSGAVAIVGENFARTPKATDASAIAKREAAVRRADRRFAAAYWAGFDAPDRFTTNPAECVRAIGANGGPIA